MGERKGQNLYYPPDYDPKVGGLNKFMGTHALRERARKLHMGILIIRFEMPYNIWCEGCKNHIGMGVRYNAEKTKIGMYYTTPVYQFRMKCHLCDNHFEIKTDPGNLDYVIVSGARRQENRWDPTDNGQIVPETKEAQKKLFDDAMFRLEHKTGDEETAKLDNPRLGRLVGRNESVWKDDYEANCSLRRNFRKRRKELEESSVNDSLLLAKSSLDISLLPENEDDRNMASLLSLRPSKSVEESQTQTRSKILNTPALPSSTGLLTSFGGLKKEESLSKTTSLTRQGLGITLKRSKIQNKNGTDNKISETKEDSKLEQKLITESNNLKDSIKINSEVPNVPNKHENDVKVDQKKIDILNIKKDEVENTCANNIAVDKVEAKNVSLVGDYSSSDENSE
ncbi:coiled-coil domain-containing protein 130 homolog [Spodoptera litura]|uniref:Coiled-coil domain-containing protein 130 homolog n=1 Tax=Spodoptera litura TaxID=69820 RepID=A0A9J7EI31_SPOLT|nr:coiled-coil domain-containing protein 130 homolog [Spodoptera litura]XP_022827980.1 coiled-coil domain-containing protein 130 homolog [Spodoptera litura]